MTDTSHQETMMRGVLLMLGAAALLTACGEASMPKAPATPSTPATESKPPPSQLGHYSSPDGFVSMVIDRTGENPRIQLKGSSDIVEMFVEEALDRGEMIGHWLNGPDGRHWMLFGKDGRIWFFKPEVRPNVTLSGVRAIGIGVSRDADAQRLGAATQKGIATPPPEKTPYDKAQEQLAAKAVVTKFAQFKPEDSGNLAKVEEALKVIDAAMLVRVGHNGNDSVVFAPASEFIGDVQQGLGGRLGGFPAPEEWKQDAKGLAKFGGILKGRVAFPDPSRLRVHNLKGWPPPVVAGTPGMVWMVSGSTVVFVSLDGGRYELSIPSDPTQGMPLENGAGPVASWPAPIQHALVDVDSIRGFAKGHAIPEATAKEIESLDDGWFECVGKLWDATRKQQEKLAASQEGADQKRGKMAGLARAAEQKVDKECGPAKKKLEDGLVKFIENRAKERTSLFEKAKGRVAELGAK